jgi:hypothetical protein
MSPQNTLTAVPPSGNRLEVIETPRGPTKRQDEYVRYLQSQRWRTLARAVCIRAKESVQFASVPMERSVLISPMSKFLMSG